jgi:DNA-binding transcriptional regulator YhcF (GntR family)
MISELVINRDSNSSVSKQIAEFFRNKIKSEDILPGDRLPTTVEIVKEFGVGTHTVRKAMVILSEEGLVTSSPKLGTIVNESQTSETGDNKNGQELSSERIIAVSSLLNYEGDETHFREETAEGIIKECERLGISVVILPSNVMAKSPEDLCQFLTKLGCSGLVFQGMSLSSEKADFLIERGINVITTRRFKFKDNLACIESDYEGAGYDVGLYYYSINCDKVTIFSHFELSCDINEASQFGYPLGIKQGIYRALESKGLIPEIDFYVNKSSQNVEKTNQIILSRLKAVDENTGIVFTNAYQLLNLLKAHPDEATRILMKRKFTVISNKTTNKILKDYIGDLEFMVLLDLYEDIAREVVGKLLGIIEGYLSRNSTTLSEVKFLPFNKIEN